MKRFTYGLLIACSLLIITSLCQAADFEISLVPEAEHMSHMTQHRPFTDHPTEYGANMLGIGLQLDYRALTVALVESYNLSPSYQVYGAPEHGEIMGAREEFSLRVQYKLTVWSK